MKLRQRSILSLSLLWTVSLFLFPLLFLQGWYVRRTALRLPGGAVPDAGSYGQGEVTRIVGLGDSVIAGVGVENMCDSVTACTADYLAARSDGQVDWQASGINGENSTELINRLRQQGFPAADIYLVSIGVNDVTSLTGLVRWQFNMTELISLLRGRRPAHILLMAVPPMEHFRALPQPLRWVLGVRAAMLDRTLQQAGALVPGVSWVDASFEFDKKHLAVDGYHPNGTACREIARMLVHAIEETHS